MFSAIFATPFVSIIIQFLLHMARESRRASLKGEGRPETRRQASGSRRQEIQNQNLFSPQGTQTQPLIETLREALLCPSWRTASVG
jgi:hypothetical protein